MHFFVEVVLYKNPSTVIELEKGVCCQYGLLDVYDHPKMAAAAPPKIYIAHGYEEGEVGFCQRKI